MRRLPVGFVLGLWLAGPACAGPNIGSVGAVLSRDSHNGALHVRDAPEGLAADQAGLVPGDRVKMIDGVLVDELDRAGIQALLRGPIGTKVMLTIVRGEQVLHLEITRSAFGKGTPVKQRYERVE